MMLTCRRVLTAIGMITCLCTVLAMTVNGTEVTRGGGQPVELGPDVDMTYSGSLDQAGSAPRGPDGELLEEESTSSVIMVTDKSGFDREYGKYVNYIGRNMEESYYSSVPNGIITNDPVSIEVAEGKTWILYRDGEPLTAEDVDLKMIDMTGAYVLEVPDTSGFDKSRFEFRITHEMTNQLSTFEVPKGFQLTSVKLEGKGISMNSLNSQGLYEDGTYLIDFACEAIDKSYATTVMIDREPPVLALANVKNGIAAGPVSLEDGAAEDRMTILRNGEPYDLSFMKILTDHGRYEVKVTDPAGNTAAYSFTIQVYLTVSSITVIFLVIGLVAGIVWYGFHVRRHMKVR